MNPPPIPNSKRQKISIAKILLVSAASALVLTALLPVPFLAIVPGIISLPLEFIWPETSTTGELVEVGFMWMTVKKFWVSSGPVPSS